MAKQGPDLLVLLGAAAVVIIAAIIALYITMWICICLGIGLLIIYLLTKEDDTLIYGVLALVVGAGLMIFFSTITGQSLLQIAVSGVTSLVDIIKNPNGYFSLSPSTPTPTPKPKIIPSVGIEALVAVVFGVLFAGKRVMTHK